MGPRDVEFTWRDRNGVWQHEKLGKEALELWDEINRVKTDSEYAEDVKIATMHRVLETPRAAMNWAWRRRHRCSIARRSTGSVFD
jgi:hypothetical protein